MKKRITIFAFVVVLLISSLPNLVMAENTSLLDMKDILMDSKGWSILIDGNTVFKDGTVNNVSKDNVVELYGYTKEKYTDLIYDFDVVMDFENKGTWQGFMVRAKDPLNLPWDGNDCYLIVINEKQIELQRFAYKHTYLGVVTNPIRAGEKNNIRYGAINEENGVRIFLSINGNTVFDVIDDGEAAIRDGGYFSVYNKNNLTIYPSSRVGETDTPAVNNVSISSSGKLGDSINIDYSYSDIYGSAEGETEYAWYRTLANVDHYGKNMALTNEIREKYLEKIEGANGRTYTITSSDVGFNIKCGITPKSKEAGLCGVEVITDSVYIDTVENMLGNGLFFVKGSPYAISDGQRKELKENEIPFAKYGKLYVPVEFCANESGLNLVDQADGIVFVKDGAETKVSVGSSLIKKNGKSFISLNKLAEITGISAKYDASYSVGMLNNLCSRLNSVEYRKILKNIRSEIIK